MVAPGIGGAIGSQLGGVIGGSIGKNGAQGESLGSGMSSQAGLGIGTGLLQTIQANKLKKESESYLPAYADPRQSAFLAELQQKRRSIDTGADFAAGMNAIDTTNAGTNEAIVRSTGGDVAGTIQALLQSQGIANQGKNQVLAQGQQQQMQYNQLYKSTLDRIEQRKLELQMYRSQQARAEWAKKQQIANQNMMAGLGRAVQENTQNIGQISNTVSPVNKGITPSMDWINNIPTTPISGNSVYGVEPIMVQDNASTPSVDLSIFNQGAL